MFYSAQVITWLLSKWGNFTGNKNIHFFFVAGKISSLFFHFQILSNTRYYFLANIFLWLSSSSWGWWWIDPRGKFFYIIIFMFVKFVCLLLLLPVVKQFQKFPEKFLHCYFLDQLYCGSLGNIPDIWFFSNWKFFFQFCMRVCVECIDFWFANFNRLNYDNRLSTNPNQTRQTEKQIKRSTSSVFWFVVGFDKFIQNILYFSWKFK